MANNNNIKFSPAIPIPLVFDVEARIQQLHGYLDPNNPHYQPEQQHVNIRAAIKMHEQGEIDMSKFNFIREGKLITRKESFRSPGWSWAEGMGHQYAAEFSYGHGPFGVEHHEIRMLLRLLPEQGGDGTISGIIVMNDTGSDVLTLFNTDLAELGNIQAYAGWLGMAAISGANGAIDWCPMLAVQVQLVRNDLSSWSEWIDETAIIRPLVPGILRLSGVGIREQLYFGTAPGNATLAVSATKCGLSSLL